MTKKWKIVKVIISTYALNFDSKVWASPFGPKQVAVPPLGFMLMLL